MGKCEFLDSTDYKSGDISEFFFCFLKKDYMIHSEDHLSEYVLRVCVCVRAS